MSLNVSGGMNLAAQQPAEMVRGPVNVKGSTKHRLGLLKMKIGTSHPIKVAGRPLHLVVRDAQTVDAAFGGIDKAKPVVVCLHAGCEGKTWNSEDEMRKAHRPQGELVKAGEIHVFGWFSSEPYADDSTGAAASYTARLLSRGESFVAKMKKECDEAKDFEAMQSAVSRLELAEKQLAGLKKLQAEKQSQIVGFVSDVYLEQDAG